MAGGRRWRAGLVATVAAGLLAIPMGTVLAAHQFYDVPGDHPFHQEIAWLVDEEVADGYEDGSFQPTRAVSRQAAAAFLFRLAGEPDGVWTTEFGDVPWDHHFHDEIAWGAEQSITRGYPNNTFRPMEDVTRQAAAAFLFRAAGEPTGAWTHSFSDVPSDHPFADAIGWMATEGITSGYADGTFKPTAPVNRQAIASFLAKYDAAGYTVRADLASDGFPDVPVCTAADTQLSPGLPSGATDVNRALADVDGDRRADQVITYMPPGAGQWWLRFETAADYVVELALIGADGGAPVAPRGTGRIGQDRDVVFVREGTGASTDLLAVFGFTERVDGRACDPGRVMTDDSTTFFPVGGTVGVADGIVCEDAGGTAREELVLTRAEQQGDGSYAWSEQVWRWPGDGTPLEHVRDDDGTVAGVTELSDRLGFNCRNAGAPS